MLNSTTTGIVHHEIMKTAVKNDFLRDRKVINLAVRFNC